MRKINKYLKERFSQSCFFNVPLSRLTSFKIGGEAQIFFCPGTIEELRKMIHLIWEENLRHFIIGNGTNVLVDDKGIPGVTICLKKGFRQYHCRETTVVAGAGILLPGLAYKLAEKGIGGLEPLSGIPGNMGGVVTQNAGAGGTEISQFVKSIHALDEKGDTVVIGSKEAKFGYRKSIFQKARLTITKVELKLYYDNSIRINQNIRAVRIKRNQRMPMKFPSAGSIFKKPDGYYAGALIEKAGLKGFKIGGAKVSEKHANWIINVGGATSRDVISIMRHVQKKVIACFGVELEPEIILVPDQDITSYDVSSSFCFCSV